MEWSFSEQIVFGDTSLEERDLIFEGMLEQGVPDELACIATGTSVRLNLDLDDPRESYITELVPPFGDEMLQIVMDYFSRHSGEDSCHTNACQ